MNRILIVGISGTGKTRLANQLAKKLSLPIVLLDSIFWKSNWQEENPGIVESKISQALKGDKWIIEGYIEPLGRQRAERADEIIYLDYPGVAAMLGGLQRWKQYRNKTRPEMPEGNTESLGIKFLLTLLRRDERPEIEKALHGYGDKVVRLKSRKSTERYFKLLS
jgi:adenylate kinase family enzyme